MLDLPALLLEGADAASGRAVRRTLQREMSVAAADCSLATFRKMFLISGRPFGDVRAGRVRPRSAARGPRVIWEPILEFGICFQNLPECHHAGATELFLTKHYNEFTNQRLAVCLTMHRQVGHPNKTSMLAPYVFIRKLNFSQTMTQE